MKWRRRGTMVLGIAAGIAAVSLLSAPPLWASPWGEVDCDQHPVPGCDLGVGDDGDRDAGVRGPGRGSGDDSQCTYTPATPDWVAEWEEHNGPLPEGKWPYLWRCEGSNQVWVILGPEGDPPSPEEVAREARSRLVLPQPQIAASPAGGQLVGLPTWLWLDRASWRPRSETASVPGMSVTVTATPTVVSWSMGDGATVTCTGPGTPYLTTANPGASSPTCGHTYRRSSAGQPDETFTVTATVQWTVRWAGAGQPGTFPNLTTSSSAEFRVGESHALNQ